MRVIADLKNGIDLFAKDEKLRKFLFVCGVISSILYIGSDIIAALLWENYNYTSQAVSELMAIEAPTRPLMVILFTIYNILVVAFGFGIITKGSQKWNLRVIGFLLIGYGILGQVGLLFFPMHLPGTTEVITTTDTMHLILAGVMVLFLLLTIGFGAAIRGKWFRLYSIGTILILLIFGALASMQASKIAEQLPTLGLGIMERINIYSSMVWLLVLAIVFLRQENIPK